MGRNDRIIQTAGFAHFHLVDRAGGERCFGQGRGSSSYECDELRSAGAGGVSLFLPAGLSGGGAAIRADPPGASGRSSCDNDAAGGGGLSGTLSAGSAGYYVLRER